MEIEAITRKWGNSIVVVIPARVTEELKIKENEKLIVKFEKKKPLLVRDVFGMLKGKFTRSTQEMKDEARAGWMSATDRQQEEEWRKKQEQSLK
jgi:antitoxin component of MazEF toxin-antitoxin module